VAFVYDVPVDPAAANNPHSLALQLIGRGRRVLEIGCAAGHVTRALRHQGCRVTGIELDAAAAEHAGQWADSVVVGDVEDVEVWKQLDGEIFDVVLFGDVLEHLKDPATALRSATGHLGPAGSVIASIPNIGHADVRIALLNGTFSYRDVGLLDRTHLRFFTGDTVRRLFEDAGLAIVEMHRVVIPMFGTELGVQPSDASDEVVDKILADPEAETYQFVVRATPAPAGQPAPGGDAVVDDRRPHATDSAIRQYRARIHELEEALAKATDELAAIQSTKTFRLVAPARELYSRLRQKRRSP
jgi:2-polyprenyl-3-methyl-5-hydroxy-6-metoxy-1,4-benzoquinol methylase